MRLLHLDISGDANNVVIRIREDQPQRFERIASNATLEISACLRGRASKSTATPAIWISTTLRDPSISRRTMPAYDSRILAARREWTSVAARCGSHVGRSKESVEIKGHGADIELEDIGGTVNVDGTYNGTIELRKLAKPLRFNGPRTNLSVEGVPGEVSMSLGDFNGSKFTGPTHLTRRSSDVEISDFTGPLDISLERGDLNLRPGLPLASIQAHLRSGDIRLSLPAAAQFSLNAVHQ